MRGVRRRLRLPPRQAALHMPRGQPKALTKAKELSVYQALQAADIAFEYQKHLPFHGCDLDSETGCAYVLSLYITSCKPFHRPCSRAREVGPSN